jgi:hypothetical protein
MSIKNFIPSDLLTRCNGIVQLTHKTHGYLNLPSLIVQKEYMIILSLVDTTFAIMQSANSAFKLIRWLYLSIPVIIILAIIFSWWILLILIIALGLIRVLTINEKKDYMFLSAYLLSLEMLINDFAGWSKINPQEKEQALQLMKDVPSDKLTYWLDFYLPRRNEISEKILKDFGPN